MVILQTQHPGKPAYISRFHNRLVPRMLLEFNRGVEKEFSPRNFFFKETPDGGLRVAVFICAQASRFEASRVRSFQNIQQRHQRVGSVYPPIIQPENQPEDFTGGLNDQHTRDTRDSDHLYRNGKHSCSGCLVPDVPSTQVALISASHQDRLFSGYWRPLERHESPVAGNKWRCT